MARITEEARAGRARVRIDHADVDESHDRAPGRRTAPPPRVKPMHTRPTPQPASTLPPPLKWAGGKRWQVPLLASLMQEHRHRRLVEPFCGGLAITLGVAPGRALLNDVNPHVINFYQWLQKGLTISLPMRNHEDLYYRHRTRFNTLLSRRSSRSAEAASLFYYLNRTGYNGLCRFNGKGEFNVPFGRYVRINYVTDFSGYVPLLSPWDFTARDFAALETQPEDFIYADPPYDVEFTKYARTGFSWDDQVRAAEWLARHPGPVVLANQATPRILALYRKLQFKVRKLDGPRRISCTGDRQPAREVLAVRNL